jgi:plasmid stabilization system protein ParE
MNVVFHPAAQEEAKKATAHHSEIHKELGRDFRKELEVAVLRIVQAPSAWHPFIKEYRRCILNRFPFGVIYRVEASKNECQVFAVMHFKRKPGYWQSRKF